MAVNDQKSVNMQIKWPRLSKDASTIHEEGGGGGGGGGGSQI